MQVRRFASAKAPTPKGRELVANQSATSIADHSSSWRIGHPDYSPIPALSKEQVSQITTGTVGSKNLNITERDLLELDTLAQRLSTMLEEPFDEGVLMNLKDYNVDKLFNRVKGTLHVDDVPATIKAIRVLSAQNRVEDALTLWNILKQNPHHCTLFAWTAYLNTLCTHNQSYLARKELKEMVEALTDAVCICTWVPFNEGWGQFDAAAATALLWTLDPTRPVDHASGWHDQGAGDYKSIHKYIFKVRPPHPDGRAFALTEYGGYSQVLDGHVWDKENSFGYRMYPDKAALTAAYRKLHEEQILPLLKKGLCVSIYTQLTDVELEVNGLFTYDRAVCKLDEAVVKEINQKLVL